MSKLPSGWAVEKFTTILDINGGTQPPKKEFISEPKEGYIRLLQIRDFGKKPVPTYIPDNGKRRICTMEDILIGRYGASVGRICTGMEGAYNVALARVAKPNQIDTGFLKYFLESHYFQQPLGLLSRSAQNGFNKQDLSAFNLLIPPLNEQISIANKLDSLLAKVDAAQTRLEKIPTLLKRFRQSIRAAATSGELTREWRGNAETTWPKVVLKDVASGFNYGSSTKSQLEGLVPVLRMGNLQSGRLDWEKLVYTSDDVEIAKYLLEPGDVLFNRTNSPELVGKTSIYRGERKSIFAGYLIRIKGTEKLNSERDHGAVWARQFDNPANKDIHYSTTGTEIWEQTNGTVDGFICSVGTGGTLAGVGAALKERNADIKIGLADPMGSAMYSYYNSGELKAEGGSIAEGIGISILTDNMKAAIVDIAYQIHDKDALPYIYSLLQHEGLCLGGSSAINIAGAVKLAKELGPGNTIVTILCDYGNRYQSKLFNPAFLRRMKLPIPSWLEG